MTLRDNLYEYLYLKGERIDGYYEQLRSQYRIIDADEVDYIEMIIAKTRRDLFREIVHDILNLRHSTPDRKLSNYTK